MNRISRLFKATNKKILSIYFTAGHPKANSCMQIIEALEKYGADMVEIGIPYSDPLADGPVIQQSSAQALNNGMTLSKLLNEIQEVRKKIKIPLLLMGYLNPILQYGMDNFCKKISQIGIDGVILPDMPLEIYHEKYKPTFDSFNIIPIFLVTPSTPYQRIKNTDKASTGFIYVVSSASTTGNNKAYDKSSLSYFENLNNMNLNTPMLSGFGISTPEKFAQATTHTQGGIIGSAFIKAIHNSNNLSNSIKNFMKPYTN